MDDSVNIHNENPLENNILKTRETMAYYAKRSRGNNSCLEHSSCITKIENEQCLRTSTGKICLRIDYQSYKNKKATKQEVQQALIHCAYEPCTFKV